MNFVRSSMLAWGLIMLGMGVQAYFFPHEGGKPSLVSLIAAGGMGFVMLLLTLWAVKARVPRAAYICAIVVALLAAGNFLSKVPKGDLTFYPGGITIIFSIGLIAILGAGHMLASRQKKVEPVDTLM